MTRRSEQAARVETAVKNAADRADASVTALEAGLHARLDKLAAEVAGLAETVRQVMASRAEHDAGVAHDVKAARNAAEMAFAGVQSLAAIATAAEREKKAAVEAARKAEASAVPAPEAAAAGEAGGAGKKRP